MRLMNAFKMIMYLWASQNTFVLFAYFFATWILEQLQIDKEKKQYIA